MATGFAVFLSYSGVPTLRHDWSSWIPPGAFVSNSWSSVAGWRTDGFGSPRAYPTDYLLVAANTVVFVALGSRAGYVADAFFIGFAVAAGASRLVERWASGSVVALAVQLVAVFNPWVYNQVVAGHIFMVLAYGGLLLLLSELVRPEPSQFRTSAFLLLSMGQLQFFLPALAAVAVWTFAGKRPSWPLVLGAAASLPVWIGLGWERQYLEAIPYSLQWQENQSVDPASALVLAGYFATYAEALPWYAGASTWIVVATAAAGAIAGLFRAPRTTLCAIAGAFLVWALVGGTKGLLAAPYAWLVANVPETGLYRELYDAVAFLCIAYLVGCAVAIRTFPPVRWAVLTAGLGLLAGWIVVPPARYWVPAQLLPTVTVGAPANARYALLPPLQPLRYLWGSGLDPDALVLPNNVTPLNTPQFGYPESPALMRYALTGDARWLKALSVAEAIARPEYRMDVGKLGDELAVPVPAVVTRLEKDVAFDPIPELALSPLPGLSEIPQPLWKNAVFFGDASSARGPSVPQSWQAAPRVITVQPASNRVSAADGWVDARSAFVAFPDLSQGLGGTITTNPFAMLAVDPDLWTLAYVKGRLEDASGKRLARDTTGYRWFAPWRASRLRCRGTCIVVAQTSQPFSSPAEIQGDCAAPLTFRLPLSWLAVSTLPSSGRCLLRYNVRYDPHWTAYAGGSALAHVAIDSTANGWIVPAHDGERRLVIVERVAGIQFAAEMFALLLIVGLSIAYGVRKTWRPHAS